MTKTAAIFALFGDVVYTPSPTTPALCPGHYIVCENGLAAGVFAELPGRYAHIPVYDFSGHILLPGLCDTHLHAPQYAFRGVDMDAELLEWLNTRTFPEEAKYASLDYAKAAYTLFADALRRSATTRAAIFATVHVPATRLLMQLLEDTGLRCFVGKVSMDRNAPDALLEGDADAALHATEQWINASLADFSRTRPIITPRFVPSCSEKLLRGLGKLARKYGLPVQSHLSENTGEADWVRRLCPWSDSYADVYEIFDLLGDGLPTVMAHCVHSGDYEQERLKSRGVLVAHCPASNINLCSGIAPVRKYMENGVAVALGTDIAGGHDLSMLRAMADAIQASKALSCCVPGSGRPLRVAEALYMATKGASPLFGHVGSFEEGYEMDCVVLDDSALASPIAFTLAQRLERLLYLDRDVLVRAKFVRGERVYDMAKGGL